MACEVRFTDVDGFKEVVNNGKLELWCQGKIIKNG